MKENDISHLHGTCSRMQGQGLVNTDNLDKVQVPTAVPVPVPVPIAGKPKITEKEVRMDPVPVDVWEQEWNLSDDKVIIEEEAPKSKMGYRSQLHAQPLPDKTVEHKKPATWKLAISAHIDLVAVLTWLLSTPVQLQVGEVLGVSREISGLLNDSIKFKVGGGKPLVASSFVTRTRWVLIKLHMECDGIPVVAIIDTGS
jgi:hypothetical protein